MIYLWSDISECCCLFIFIPKEYCAHPSIWDSMSCSKTQRHPDRSSFKYRPVCMNLGFFSRFQDELFSPASCGWCPLTSPPACHLERWVSPNRKLQKSCKCLKLQETCWFCGVFVGGQQYSGEGGRLEADSISFQLGMDLMKPRLIGKILLLMSAQTGFCTLSIMIYLISVTDVWKEAEQRICSDWLLWGNIPSWHDHYHVISMQHKPSEWMDLHQRRQQRHTFRSEILPGLMWLNTLSRLS